VLPVDGGVVAAEPGNAKDDGVIADTADIEGARFLVGADTEGSRNGMGDRTRGYRAAIDDMEWAGDGFLDKVKFVSGDKSVIYKEGICAGVNESLGGYDLGIKEKGDRDNKMCFWV
jgi:hypothetical protein